MAEKVSGHFFATLLFTSAGWVRSTISSIALSTL